MRIYLASSLAACLAMVGCGNESPTAPTGSSGTVIGANPTKTAEDFVVWFRGPSPQPETPPRPTEWVNLNFVIRDACTEVPLAGATVEIAPSWNDPFRKTDAGGFANFGVPKDIEVAFQTWKEGYYGLETSEIHIPKDVTFQVFLPPYPPRCGPRPYLDAPAELGRIQHR